VTFSEVAFVCIPGLFGVAFLGTYLYATARRHFDDVPPKISSDLAKRYGITEGVIIVGTRPALKESPPRFEDDDYLTTPFPALAADRSSYWPRRDADIELRMDPSWPELEDTQPTNLAPHHPEVAGKHRRLG